MNWIIRLAAAALALAIPAAAFADVTIDAPWIRGVVPGQSVTGAFMTIRSTEATSLIGVHSPAASEVGLHRTAMVDGMMSMEPVESLAVPAHGSVQLAPGGLHVMLVGLRTPLRAGQKVPLTLTFRSADHRQTIVTVQAEVRDVTGEPSHDRR